MEATLQRRHWNGNELSEIEFQSILIDERSKKIFRNNYGNLVFADYNLVKMALQRNDLFVAINIHERVKTLAANFNPNLDFLADSMRYWILFLEGDEHLFYKKKLTQKLYELDLASIVKEEAINITNECQHKNSFDLVLDFVEPFIVRIMARISNLPVSETQTIRNFAREFMQMSEPFATLRAFESLNNEAEKFKDFLIEKAKPFDSEKFISFWKPIATQFDKENWNEVFSLIEFFTFSGIETSIHLISRALTTIIRDENLQSHLKNANKNEFDLAIDELIRVSGPVNYVLRIATQDVEFGGVEIKKGEKIFLSLATANINDKIFDTPFEINFARYPNPHLSFGFSKHFCIGTTLTKIEINELIPPFLNNFSKHKLNLETVKYESRIIFRSLKTATVSIN